MLLVLNEMFLKNLKLIDTCIFQFAAEYVLIQAVSFLSKNAREPNDLTNHLDFDSSIQLHVEVFHEKSATETILLRHTCQNQFHSLSNHS